MTNLTPLEFLREVWGERKGWIDLPSKVGGYWVPWHHRWPCDGGIIEERVRSCVEDGEDLYFSAAMFNRRGRDIRTVLSSGWLWADLDEVDAGAVARQGLLPSLVWQSSPGRFQALWRLDRRLRPEVQSRLNRRLSYTIGADRGGWDSTQVLRIPGTRNFKYEGGPTVEVVLANDKVWHPGKMWRVLKRLDPSYDSRRVVMPGDEPAAIAGGMERGAASPPLPARVQRLLSVSEGDVVKGERSHRRWELECALIEAGLSVEQVADKIYTTPWNSWGTKGRARLEREAAKAYLHVGKQNGAGAPSSPLLVPKKDKPPRVAVVEEAVVEEGRPEKLPFIRYSSFMAQNMEAPRWLIEDIWTAGSHGILGGEPKVSKSTLALAMGLSIASGKDFLGEFSVPSSSVGPVMMIQEENDPWVMQDRMRKIASFYGLIHKGDVSVRDAREGEAISKKVMLEFPDDVPFRLLNNYGFSLSSEEHREMLEEAVATIRPRMLILDPLYMLVGGVNMDRQHEITPYLKWLTRLRYEYGVAPLIVHHWRKQRSDEVSRGGQRLMGSAMFHGWVEAALYAEKLSDDDEEELRVRLEREYRNVGSRGALELHMTMGAPGDLGFSAHTVTFSVDGKLIAVVTEAGGSITATAAGEALGVDKRTVLKYARGSAGLLLEGGKRGRGHSWTIRLAE